MVTLYDGIKYQWLIHRWMLRVYGFWSTMLSVGMVLLPVGIAAYFLFVFFTSFAFGYFFGGLLFIGMSWLMWETIQPDNVVGEWIYPIEQFCKEEQC